MHWSPAPRSTAQGIDLHVYVATGESVLQDTHGRTRNQAAPPGRVIDQQIRIALNKRARGPGRDHPGRVRANPVLQHAKEGKRRDAHAANEQTDPAATRVAASWFRPAGFEGAIHLHLPFRSAIRSPAVRSQDGLNCYHFAGLA